MKEKDNDNEGGNEMWIFSLRVPLKFKRELESMAKRRYRNLNSLMTAILADSIQKDKEANHAEGAN